MAVASREAGEEYANKGERAGTDEGYRKRSLVNSTTCAPILHSVLFMLLFFFDFT